MNGCRELGWEEGIDYEGDRSFGRWWKYSILYCGGSYIMAYVKIHWTVYLNKVNFTVCKLFLTLEKEYREEENIEDMLAKNFLYLKKSHESSFWKFVLRWDKIYKSKPTIKSTVMKLWKSQSNEKILKAMEGAGGWGFSKGGVNRSPINE